MSKSLIKIDIDLCCYLKSANDLVNILKSWWLFIEKDSSILKNFINNIIKNI